MRSCSLAVGERAGAELPPPRVILRAGRRRPSLSEPMICRELPLCRRQRRALQRAPRSAAQRRAMRTDVLMEWLLKYSSAAAAAEAAACVGQHAHYLLTTHSVSVYIAHRQTDRQTRYRARPPMTSDLRACTSCQLRSTLSLQHCRQTRALAYIQFSSVDTIDPYTAAAACSPVARARVACIFMTRALWT